MRADGASDAELIGKVVQRDQNALGALYDRYGKLLYSVALRITGDPGAAEEILQDTFFQLWMKASRYDEARGSLAGWLLTITRYRAISRLRTQGDDSSSERELDANQMPAPDESSLVLRQQIARELASAGLAALSQAQRKAISLAYFEGLTCKEIADRTRAPVGTTKSRLRSGLLHMKKAITEGKKRGSVFAKGGPCTLDDIVITDELARRSFRIRNPQQESVCLRSLGDALLNAPDQLVDVFLAMAIDLCRAGTAGFSFLESDERGEPVFRWTNLAGLLKSYVGGTTPRHFSPCGYTLDQNRAQLFSYPGRYFSYFSNVSVPIVEGLVIPFRAATTEATVWIVSHEESIRFDAEDARIMTVLTEFAGCALHIQKSLQSLPPA